MKAIDFLASEVPDAQAAGRFLEELGDKYPARKNALEKDRALLSDVLVLVSCSPLFASTLLLDPEILLWLGRERGDTRVRDKHALLESLARYSLTNSQVDPHVCLARFRRRELMRIFLRDIRRLATVAEITEEISNLADAILEHALRLSQQELDNRFGQAQEEDERGRLRPTEFCVVSLGKLGSKELNYSSDIDLLFIYSDNGRTAGTGTNEARSNIEYFSKLSETIIRLVGGQGGEGAAYRVDMRLRPHGRVGPLALALKDAVRYYNSEAAPWERQVLIRARASAGSEALFRRFYDRISDAVFSVTDDVAGALRNVELSKQKIDLNTRNEAGIDIKLGSGGIREIEFIAQALMLAFAGNDKWLRVSHTLISLDRLADRGYLNGEELSQLFDAYDFLRRLEHILQIENGLQTHLVPNDMTRRSLIAKRLGKELANLDNELRAHTDNVKRIFGRVFNRRNDDFGIMDSAPTQTPNAKSDTTLNRIRDFAPRFLDIVNAHPDVIEDLPNTDLPFPNRDYSAILRVAAASAGDFAGILRELRRSWYRYLIEIVVFDIFGKLELAECKHVQTELAEAAIDTALLAAKAEVEKRFGFSTNACPLAILALGKLGSGGLDYDSDLDLVFVHCDEKPSSRRSGRGRDATEYFSRIVELFTNILSSITRDGFLYRVDMRLRPHGSDGPLVISRTSIVEYFQENAAIWELLAYVKLRAVGGDPDFAALVEDEIRDTIHQRALKIDPAELAAETRNVRKKLEMTKADHPSKGVDIKYGPGGLLDVYFTVRYLQLRFNISDDSESRTTQDILRKILVKLESGELMATERRPSIIEALISLIEGYRDLSCIDHFIRLVNGRGSKLVVGSLRNRSHPMVRSILESQDALALQRISVRDAFDTCLEV